MNEYRNAVNKATKEVEWTLSKFFLKIFVPFTILIILIGGIGWSIRIMTQPAKILEKTLDADKVISDYEWFKQTYKDLQATDLKISNVATEFKEFKSFAGDRKEWTFEDKNEYSRLSSTLTGLKNYREDLVAQYNARAKMLTRKFFMGKDIPDQLN